MGRRGPKAVKVEHLKNATKQWGLLLFGVRDGAYGTAEKWGQQLTIELARPTNRARTEGVLRDLEKSGYEIGWPVYRQPEIWDQLKRARSPKEASAAFAALRKWNRRELLGQGKPRDSLLHSLQVNPHDFLRAKRLPNYPRDKKTNDDKRIVFFCKVFAGLEAGLAPLTTTKKLSHWSFESYWKGVGVAYVKSMKVEGPKTTFIMKGRTEK